MNMWAVSDWLLAKSWGVKLVVDDPLATKISDAISTLGLGEDTFRPLNEQDSNDVLRRTRDEFLTHPPHENWWWESFREPQWSVQFQDQRGYERLAMLVPPNEKCWFIASGESRFLVFEGTIEAIQAVIGECYFFEYYVVSQSYDWLLCENHHDFIIAVGSFMVERLRKAHANISR